MGSVKDVRVLVPASENAPGIGRFVFSDRYSVFDWGKMPDDIENKGSAICIATAYFFELLENMGVKTQYRGVVEDGEVKPLAEAKGPINELEFDLLRVIKPELKNGSYDYSAFSSRPGNILIPLEVIYRNSLPAGSSVFKRLERGDVTPHELGLDSMPVPGQRLYMPILDVSSKLEETDRYMSWTEAREIAGLSDDEYNLLRERTLMLDQLISEQASRLGLINEDGKVEYGFDIERNLVVVDALGTLDECRFTYKGIPMSKEVARIFYRSSDWYRRVEEAKKKDRLHWRKLVGEGPKPLPERFRSAISALYMAYANELTAREWFDVMPLSEAIAVIEEFIS
ncbi:phosphoribosylaminoimidazolesuccinocarboxamide synthase [Spirochaetia bacterium 38H-sp]|uniref:Phosphoribosylaminoimidazole-succinocarboxamide synthase n=1 Tax=Rarispira pelagica TaxID=3141764 RepID=A0ABU9UC67_9SPIR